MIHLTENHIIVPLPEVAHDKAIQIINGNYQLVCAMPNTLPASKSSGNVFGGFVNLPPGRWSIFCSIDEVTEEVAKKVVGIFYDNKKPMFPEAKGFINYKTTGSGYFTNALESFTSLIESKGWYLRNPYGESIDAMSDANGRPYTTASHDDWLRAEAKTIKFGVVLGKQKM